MVKATGSLLAIALGLAAAAGGCAVGPDLATSSLDSQPAGVGERLKMPNASDPDYAETYKQYRREYAERSVVAPALGYDDQDSSGAVRLASGVLGDSMAAQSISSTFKDGVGKVSRMLTPSTPVKPANDPTALASKSKPSPRLYTALGQLAERSGKFPEAEKRYQQALQLEPDYLGALLGYARLKDRQGQLNEATRLYQQAAKAHPNESAIFNDLGLCFARRRMLRESVAALERAIQLHPERRLYRNNIATVLVEMDKVDAALAQLSAVHDEAVAYYNLGYLLQKKGRGQAAVDLFAKALEKNPSLEEARIWIEKLAHRTLPDSPSETLLTEDRQPQAPSADSSGSRAPQRQAAVVKRLPATGSEAQPGTSGLRMPEVRHLPPVTTDGPRSPSSEDPPMPPSASLGTPPADAELGEVGDRGRAPSSDEMFPDSTVPGPAMSGLASPSPPRQEAGSATAPARSWPAPLVQPLPPVEDDSRRF